MLKFIAPTTAWLRHVATAAAAVVAVVGVLAGLSPDDQTRLLAAVRQLVDGATNVLVAIGAIAGIASALWARWTAKPEQQVKAVDAMPNASVVPVDPARPVTAGAPGATVSSHWLVGALALLLLAPLAACSVLSGSSSVDTTTYAKAAADAKITYDAGLKLATRYAQLPRCGQPAAPPVCSDRTVLDTMLKASDAANAATQAAENAVRSLGKDPTVVAALVKAATESVAAFSKITTTYGDH